MTIEQHEQGTAILKKLAEMKQHRDGINKSTRLETNNNQNLLPHLLPIPWAQWKKIYLSRLDDQIKELEVELEKL